MDSLKVPKGSSSTSSSPKSSSSNVPMAVRFNAGEECIDDIFKSNHNNGLGKSNSPSPSAGIVGIGNTDMDNMEMSRSDKENIYTDSVHSLSSSPSQSLQQNNDDTNLKNNFLQGNFFNRKSVPPIKSRQLSPNNLMADNAMHMYMDAEKQQPNSCSPNSLNGSGSSSSGNNMGPISPKIGSSQSPSISLSGTLRSNNESLSPNSTASSNTSSRYRRSMSFPNKMMSGCSPTNHSNNYVSDMHANVPTEGNAYNMHGGYNNGGGGGGGAGLQDMRPLDHCINDIMRNISSNENMAMAAALVERLRAQKMNEQQQQQHLSEADAVAIAAGNNATGVNYLDSALKLNSPARSSPHPPMSGAQSVNLAIVGGSGVGDHSARYSRKVFVGGLPPDIDEDEITSSFRRFGPLVVDWPHKAESKSYFPPKGYAFLLFQDENSVQQLIDACITDDDKLYLCVSSPTIKDKPVQIRPWRLADADYVLDATMSLDPRKTVFVGGVPRPLKAFELAMIMDRLYGGVCYAGIDTDPELKYPKGAGRVAFANQQSYIAAISARFVQLQHGDIDKRVEVKPYVLDDQMCDECEGQRCSGKFAPFFCANVTCLQYYCEHCWAVIHSRPGREYHKPLVKEGADRPRAVPFRWC